MKPDKDKLSDALRKHARRLAGTEEGIACAGTSLESVTVKVGGKAFLFLGPKEARLKLAASLPQVGKHVGCVAGSGGWTKVPWDAAPPKDVLLRWVDESYALFAPRPKPRG